MKKILNLSLLAAVLLLVQSKAFAEDHRERAHWHGQINYFHEHDLNLWRSGHWFHGPHTGRAGWWWVTNGIWYYYPQRIAEIPDPYVPPTVTVVQAAPAQVVVQATPVPTVAPVVQAPPPPAQMPTSPQSWYYCNNPHGYYPYVTTCLSGWVSVPAIPPTNAPSP